MRLRNLPLLIPYLYRRGASRGAFLLACSGYTPGVTLEDTEQAVLEGAISVEAALRSGSREVRTLLVSREKPDGPLRRLIQFARAKNIPVEQVGDEEISAQASGRTHGGVLALVGPRRFVTMADLVPSERPAFVVMIDGVEDPFNFGQAVRCLYAAGADGLVVRPRNWMSAAGVVARASAGASELIPTAIAETAESAAEFFRERGLRVACATDEPPTVSLYSSDLTGPLFLLIGGEKRGVTRSFAHAADLRLRIPYGRTDAHSLGTASATAVLAFEVLRQRGR